MPEEKPANTSLPSAVFSPPDAGKYNIYGKNGAVVLTVPVPTSGPK